MGRKKRNLKRSTLSVFLIGVFTFIVLMSVSTLSHATPSTSYWTPNVIDVQPFLVPHITYDNYFTVGKKGTTQGGQAFANDFGLTIGVLPWEKLQMEVGFDLVEPTDNPLFFNAKLGTPEESLFKGSPGINVGIFNVGTKAHVTNQNIVDFIVGKSIPYIGRIAAGYYHGNGSVLRSSAGKKENDGFMISWDKFIYKEIFQLAADYASGKNAIGGGGVGLYTYFTKDISLLIGPVWFNDRALNGKMKWTIQLDVNFDPSKWFKSTPAR